MCPASLLPAKQGSREAALKGDVAKHMFVPAKQALLCPASEAAASSEAGKQLLRWQAFGTASPFRAASLAQDGAMLSCPTRQWEAKGNGKLRAMGRQEQN